MDVDAIALATAQMRERFSTEFFRKMFTEEQRDKSILTVAEVSDFTRALWYARRYRQEWLETVVRDALELRVSIRGTGRKQATSVMSHVAPSPDVEERKRGLFGWVIGR